MASSTCPEDQWLIDFLVGRVPEEAAREHEPHLAVCSHCAARAEHLTTDTIDRDDSLMRSLRNASLPNESPSSTDSDAIDGLIARLSRVDGETPRIPVSGDELRRVLGEPLEPGDLGSLDGLRITDVLGAGGMGVVFRGVDPAMGRDVAVKVLRPALSTDRAAVRRFQREACAMAAVAHPFVATILEVGEADGQPYFTMPWLPGESLKSLMRRRSKLTLQELLRIATQTAAGLAAAHRAKVLHGDIKPDNIWICADDDQVRILDFGLARGIDSNAAVSQTDALLGTPSYMAPEQIRGEAIDERADLFALGCLLYHAATGEAPFGGPHAIATLIRVAQDQPAPLVDLRPELGANFSDLVARLMEKSPARRPASTMAVVQQLKQMQASVSPAGSFATPSSKSGWIRRALPWLIALGFAGGFLFQIIQVLTDRGTLVIEADDEVAVLIDSQRVTLQDRVTGKEYLLRVGQQPLPSGLYEVLLSVPDSELEFSSRQFRITRGSREPIQVTLKPTIGSENDVSNSDSMVGEDLSAVPSDSAAASENTNDSETPETSQAIDPRYDAWNRSLVRPDSTDGSEPSWTIESTAWRGQLFFMKLSPDGERMATYSTDGVVRIWDVGRQELLTMMPLTIGDLAWSSDGSRIAVTEVSQRGESRLAIWEVQPNLRRIAEVDRQAYLVRWADNGTIAVIGRDECWFHRLDRQPVPAAIPVERFDIGETLFSADNSLLVIPADKSALVMSLNGDVSARIPTGASRPCFLPGTSMVVLAELETVSSTSGVAVEPVLKIYDTQGQLKVRHMLGAEISASGDSQPQLFATPLADGHRVVAEVDGKLSLVQFDETYSSVIAESPLPIDWSFQVPGQRSHLPSVAAASRDSLGQFVVKVANSLAFLETPQYNDQPNDLPSSESIDEGRLPEPEVWTTLAAPTGFHRFDGWSRFGSRRLVRVTTTTHGPYFESLSDWWDIDARRQLGLSGDHWETTSLNPAGDRLASIRPAQETDEEFGEASPVVRSHTEPQRWQVRLTTFDGESFEQTSEVVVEPPRRTRLHPTWSPDGRFLCLTPDDHSRWNGVSAADFLVVLDAFSGEELFRHSFAVPGASHMNVVVLGRRPPIVTPQAAWSPDSQHLLWADHEGTIRVLDVISRENVATLVTPYNTRSPSRLPNSPDRRYSFGVFWSPRGDRVLFAHRKQGAGEHELDVEVWNVVPQEGEGAPLRFVQLSAVTCGNRMQGGERQTWLQVLPDWEHDRVALCSSRETQVRVLSDLSELGTQSHSTNVSPRWLSDGSLVLVEDDQENGYRLVRIDPEQNTKHYQSLAGLDALSIEVNPSTDAIYVETEVGLYEFTKNLVWKQTWWLNQDGLVAVGPSLEASRLDELEPSYRVLREAESGVDTFTFDEWRNREARPQ